VIADEHDDRVVGEVALCDLGEQTADVVVDRAEERAVVGDLLRRAGVDLVAQQLGDIDLVVLVDVEVVHPDEARPVDDPREQRLIDVDERADDPVVLFAAELAPDEQGDSDGSVSVSRTRNMFSRYLPQWPEVSQSRLLNNSGVFTSR
jgi:hypothetical protein